MVWRDGGDGDEDSGAGRDSVTMTRTNPLPDVAPPRAARLAVMVLFFIAGAPTGSWSVLIPTVQNRLGLSDGLLGVALLGMAIGSLLAMPSTGWLIARWGSRPVAVTAALVMCLAISLPTVAPNLPLLVMALAVIGAGNGILDVSMNTQAVAIERRYHRSIMSTFHGVFSIGGLVGGASAGWITSLGVAPTPHLMTVGLVSAVLVMLAARWLLPAEIDAGGDGPAYARPSRALAGLGIVGFCVLLSEGAVADWSAVYLRNTLDTGAGFAAAGFAAFSLTMTAGRLTGDWLTARLGPVTIVRAGGVIVAAGLGLGLLIGTSAAALVGFACVGAGLAAAFPVVLSAAGRSPSLSPGTAIAAVATAGYTGFLAGPPMIGFVAEVTGLRIGLGLVVVLGLAMVLLAGAVGAPAAGRVSSVAATASARD